MNKSNWSVSDADHLYQITRWSEGFFGVDDQGHLVVHPYGCKDESIQISQIIKDLEKRNHLNLPIVLRFHDILRTRIKKYCHTFRENIERHDYNGKHFGVFPIKVNQLREVIEEVVDVGKEFNYGLEAGSKAELLSILANNENKNALSIVNGYKDREIFKLAMLGRKLGRKIIIVIEKYSELIDLLEVSKEYNVEPIIGIRSKLSSSGSGKWAASTGEFAKFGLTTSEVIAAIDLLKSQNKIHWLKLFHFHVGSQIPDIRSIRDALNEGTRIFCELQKNGCELEYFDVGGGVGLNYDGSRSKKASSVNYNLSDYVELVIKLVKDICDEQGVKHPHIVTETGRALTAHHSMVITNVFGKMQMAKCSATNTQIKDDDHSYLKAMKELQLKLAITNYQEMYNEACIIKEDALNAFKLGVLDLKTRSEIETLYWDLCEDIILLTDKLQYVPDEIANLQNSYTDTYLCNLSVFQSAPDVWAINQILPVIPVERLNEVPDNPCTLADITCDSDGKIDHFLTPEGPSRTIMLHDIDPGEKYYLALCLTGAYQDTMGDMHNLFGRLNEAHIFYDEDESGKFYIEETIAGSSTADVLSIMQYRPDVMCGQMKNFIDESIKKGSFKPKEGSLLLDEFESALSQYTYLDISSKDV
jgi:arginine decarboxylase